jgi:hypothetical protein
MLGEIVWETGCACLADWALVNGYVQGVMGCQLLQVDQNVLSVGGDKWHGLQLLLTLCCSEMRLPQHSSKNWVPVFAFLSSDLGSHSCCLYKWRAFFRCPLWGIKCNVAQRPWERSSVGSECWKLLHNWTLLRVVWCRFFKVMDFMHRYSCEEGLHAYSKVFSVVNRQWDLMASF